MTDFNQILAELCTKELLQESYDRGYLDGVKDILKSIKEVEKDLNLNGGDC